jgi:hypothetical protein
VHHQGKESQAGIKQHSVTQSHDLINGGQIQINQKAIRNCTRAPAIINQKSEIVAETA